MSFFLEVVQSAFSPMVLFYMFAGVAAGICIGALPGLTATMGVALLLPLTFGMDATSGILMLLGIYVGAIYGGSISAILLHTPGTRRPRPQPLTDTSSLNAVRQDAPSVLRHFPAISAVL